MTKALEEEIKQMEDDEKKDAEEQTSEEEATEEVVEEKPVDEVEESSEEETAEEEEPKEEVTDEELLKKQEHYRKRQEKRAQKKQEEAEATPIQEDDSEELSEIEQLKLQVQSLTNVAHQNQYNQLVDRAEIELEGYEEEFRDAFPDYDDTVNRALDITKMRMKQNGMRDKEINEHLRREKIMIADRAASSGKDPVEAVYKEAQAINGWFDSAAESMGYVKQDTPNAKPKTKMAAMREASKPNSFGSGQGTAAHKKTFDEMDDDDMEEIDGLTIGQMLKGDY